MVSEYALIVGSGFGVLISYLYLDANCAIDNHDRRNSGLTIYPVSGPFTAAEKLFAGRNSGRSLR